MTTYALFKFAHLTAMAVWVGGVIALTMLNRQAACAADAAGLRMVARSTFFGQRVIGPSAGLTLLTGIALVLMGGLGLQLWIVWGLAGVAASMALGAIFLRRASERLLEIAWDGRGRDEYRDARRRLALLAALNIALLLSVLAAMVLKPRL